MGYYSEYYLEEFTEYIVKKFVILLNRVEEKDKQKYLLIIAQDLVTDKIFKLVDTHGEQYDLCKYDENWANLQKGDIISVKCCFHKSKFCENVVRIKSNYQFVDRINYEKELRMGCDSISYNDPERKSIIKIFETDLEYLGKKLNGKHGFILYYLKNSEVIEYKKWNSPKIKYQFKIELESRNCYADITPFVPEYKEFLNQEYSGFVLLQFVFKNERLRLKVHDFSKKGFADLDDLPF
jgi:hypothetical protein